MGFDAQNIDFVS